MIGTPKGFKLEEVDSEYVLPSLKIFFSDELAQTYQPLIFSGDKYDENDPSIQPEGIYYRIARDALEQEYCIQYYVYWLEQNCTKFIGISNHRYDYEPIFVYLKPADPRPVGIVNSGQGKQLGILCRFHKAEVRRIEYQVRDPIEEKHPFTTSRSPFYPFGGENGVQGENCVKRYPISGSIYYDKWRPMFGIDTCFHSMSGAEGALHGQSISNPTEKIG